MTGEPIKQESSEVARLHSTSVEHPQGMHEVSMEEKKEGVRAYKGIKDLPLFNCLRSYSYVKTARR